MRFFPWGFAASTADARNGVAVVDAGAIVLRMISRREGVADVVGVDVDLGLARDATEVVEVDLIRAGVGVDAISLAAGDAGVVVVVAGAIFAAVQDAIAAVAADAISVEGGGVVDVVDADAGVVSARSAATVDRSVP